MQRKTQLQKEDSMLDKILNSKIQKEKEKQTEETLKSREKKEKYIAELKEQIAHRNSQPAFRKLTDEENKISHSSRNDNTLRFPSSGSHILKKERELVLASPKKLNDWKTTRNDETIGKFTGSLIVQSPYAKFEVKNKANGEQSQQIKKVGIKIGSNGERPPFAIALN